MEGMQGRLLNRDERRALARRLIPVVSGKKVELIWNTTLVCPFNCSKCCVAAVHGAIRKGKVMVSSNDLGTYTFVGIRPKNVSPHWHFDEIARQRQSAGLELDFAGKLRVLDHLGGVAPKIDFSGGDLLVVSESMPLIRQASERFGRNNVTVTATGIGLKMVDPAELAAIAGEVNITYDGTPPEDDPLVPNGYSIANLREGVRLAEHGVAVRAEIPLTLQNIHSDELERIYRALAETPIERLLVMRLFPVGRGELREDQIPTAAEYRGAIALLRSLEAELGGPTVKLQCALRHLDGGTTGVNPCDAVSESFGLMADGTLLASPWAIDKDGQPFEDWVLGNLATTPMTEILASDRVARFLDNADANFGHCKIFSGIYGTDPDPIARTKQKADPLYAEKTTNVAHPPAA